MVFDCPNICNTILSLGLGYINSTNTNDHHPIPHHNLRLDQDSKPSSAKSGGEDQPFPSLSLALPSDQKTCRDTNHDHLSSSDLMHAQGQQQASSGSATAASSFSNSSVKREIREVSGDQEVEEERISPAKNLADQEQDEEGPRKKLRLTKEQSLVLEESFKEHSTLNPKQKQALANKLNLRPRQVEVWFQNRRARTKLKQTEVDFEMLKKCCETLKEENKRLHKEVQDLKAMKVAVPPTPFYMQIPAATLSMCPSCETISASTGGGATGGSGENSSRISFSIGPKPHFYNPFTNHPSAAC